MTDTVVVTAPDDGPGVLGPSVTDAIAAASYYAGQSLTYSTAAQTSATASAASATAAAVSAATALTAAAVAVGGIQPCFAADLPAGVEGMQRHVKDARKQGEIAGAGTGAPCYFSGVWRTQSNDHPMLI